MRDAATAPVTLQVIAEAPRSERSKIVVSIDRGINGARFVTVSRKMLGRQNLWIVPRSVSLQASELRPIAEALLRAVEVLEEAAP